MVLRAAARAPNGAATATPLMDLGFLEDVPVFCYVVRREGDDFVLVRLNPAARERSPGLTAFVGRPLTELYSDQPTVRAAALRCIEEQKVVEHEVRFRMHNRTEATQLLKLRYVPAPPDLVLIYVVELKRPDMMQAALDETESRYQSLVASLPDAVMLRGADGRALFCNDAAVELFGAASQAELLGKRDVVAPAVTVRDEMGARLDLDDRPSLRVITTGKPELGQIYSFVRAGSERWMRVAAQPVRSGDGRVTGSVTTFSDVTERVVAQKALRESATRLDLALASARMGVWEYEPDADRGWWSPNLYEIFRLDRKSTSIGTFLDQVHPDDRAAITERLAATTAGTHGYTYQTEYRIVGDDGVTRWARMYGRLFVSGSRRMLVGTTMDITEHRLLEEQLHLASRLESIGRLAGGVAHDFNNLLMAMLGSLELIDGHVDQDGRDDLATIRHSAERARDLTRQLLAFARKQPVVWRTVDLSALVRDVQRLFQRLVGPRISLSIVTVGHPLVSADPTLLEQVLVNLVVNARDAMPDGGRLEIHLDTAPADPATAPHGVAELRVTDSGVGMDEATRRRIFEPFFTTKSQGNGLGLASSYGIIQQHRGDIRVESEPEHGTRFIVTLPCIPPTDGDEKQPRPPTSPTPARGTVLVVDDEEAVRKTTARLVGALGYEVLVADSGAQALARSAAHGGSIDLLLCDIAMPGEDGRDLAAKLVETRAELRVVFMSGHSSDVHDPPLEGALFLQKPFSLEELAQTLAAAARAAQMR
jgi:two-component system, cell cycle sensor histidine kinase and response regulator CckA